MAFNRELQGSGRDWARRLVEDVDPMVGRRSGPTIENIDLRTFFSGLAFFGRGTAVRMPGKEIFLVEETKG